VDDAERVERAGQDKPREQVREVSERHRLRQELQVLQILCPERQVVPVQVPRLEAEADRLDDAHVQPATKGEGVALSCGQLPPAHADAVVDGQRDRFDRVTRGDEHRHRGLRDAADDRSCQQERPSGGRRVEL
jgi:hypothetical protein